MIIERPTNLRQANSSIQMVVALSGPFRKFLQVRVREFAFPQRSDSHLRTESIGAPQHYPLIQGGAGGVTWKRGPEARGLGKWGKCLKRQAPSLKPLRQGGDVERLGASHANGQSHRAVPT